MRTLMALIFVAALACGARADDPADPGARIQRRMVELSDAMQRVKEAGRDPAPLVAEHLRAFEADSKAGRLREAEADLDRAFGALGAPAAPVVAMSAQERIRRLGDEVGAQAERWRAMGNDPGPAVGPILQEVDRCLRAGDVRGAERRLEEARAALAAGPPPSSGRPTLPPAALQGGAERLHRALVQLHESGHEPGPALAEQVHAFQEHMAAGRLDEAQAALARALTLIDGPGASGSGAPDADVAARVHGKLARVHQAIAELLRAGKIEQVDLALDEALRRLDSRGGTALAQEAAQASGESSDPAGRRRP